MKDLYAILGTDDDCTLLEVKEAYRKLSKKFHPDLNQGDYYFDNRFRDINEAYETLGDPAKRKRYDELFKTAKDRPFSPIGTYNTGKYEYKARSSGFYVSRIKGPGAGMLITLIIIALVLSFYGIQYYNRPKKLVADNVPAATAPIVKTHIHHKRMHLLKSKISGDSFKVIANIAVPKISMPAKVIAKPTTPIAIKPIIEATPQPAAEKIKQTVPVVTPAVNKTALYSTSVKANVTGFINMRQFDTFGSPVIKTIPANANVDVLARSDSYYKISFGGVEGFVPKWSLLTK